MQTRRGSPSYIYTNSLTKMEVEDELDEPMKRPKRKPNFTPPERMHLAKSYVESVEEYNRGFTSATRGDAKHGRQRLLEKWAAELTAFGVVERTTVEVEQKLRDYMKKIIGNNKRPHKRPLSPAAELLSTVLPQCSNANVDESGVAIGINNTSDPQTEYADFLLRQHRAASHDSVDNSYIAEAEVTPPGPTIDFSVHIDETVRMQRALLSQQLENARAEHNLKKVEIENARIEQKIRLIELEKRKLELEKIRKEFQLDLSSCLNHLNGSTSQPEIINCYAGTNSVSKAESPD